MGRWGRRIRYFYVGDICRISPIAADTGGSGGYRVEHL